MSTNPGDEFVLLDIDSTCLDLSTEWILKRYNPDWNDNLKPSDITQWGTHHFVKPECGDCVYEYLNDPTLYDEMQPIDGALEAVEEIRSWGLHPLFVTSGMHVGKFNRMKELGFLPPGYKGDWDYVTNHWKAETMVPRILVDDRGETIRNWYPRLGILFDQPWNRGIQVGIRAVGRTDREKWENVLGYIRGYYGG